MTNRPKAVILLSEGLDSATVLAIAQSEGFNVHALSFRYGQRHSTEIRMAECLVARHGVRSHRTEKGGN
ncbi:MAG: 7-cyano-7-deazaguanine synthase [Planctomycetaceae bacterium]